MLDAAAEPANMGEEGESESMRGREHQERKRMRQGRKERACASRRECKEERQIGESARKEGK